MKTLIQHTLTLGTLLVAAMGCGSGETLSDAGKLASGNDALCHLSKSGKLRCWGYSPEYNTTGGVPHREDFVARHGEEGAYSIPYEVFPEWRFLDVAMAERSTCAIRDDGMLFCWGDQAWGQKGGLAADGTREGLVQVGNDTDWRSVAGDADIDGATYCAIKTSGQLWCWGSNRWDQLGQGEDFVPPNDRSPIQVGTDTDWATVELSLGGACALKENGTLWCWGDTMGAFARYDESGSYPTMEYKEPTQPKPDMTFIDIHLKFGSCVVSSDHEVYCWGPNNYGSLAGLPPKGGVNPMWKLEPAGKPVKVASSSGTNCVLTQAGEIECNGYGTRLGRGELDASYTLYTDRQNPFLGSYEFGPILKPGPFVDIWAGGTSICAAHQDGTIWCWGDTYMDMAPLMMEDQGYAWAPARLQIPQD